MLFYYRAHFQLHVRLKLWQLPAAYCNSVATHQQAINLDLKKKQAEVYISMHPTEWTIVENRDLSVHTALKV